jgi:hypothetical protein
MGFLSRFFNNSQSQPESYVVLCAEGWIKKYQNSSDITPERMFAVFIYKLSTFIKKDPNNKFEKETDIDSFATDSVLFELGCYMYVVIDLWLFQNRPQLRNNISDFFAQEFCTLFTTSLRISNVKDLFNQRIRVYGQLINSKADAEKYVFYLTQLILRTKGNKKPVSYNFDKEPLMTADIFESVNLKTKLMNWLVAFQPSIIQTVEEQTNLMTS